MKAALQAMAAQLVNFALAVLLVGAVLFLNAWLEGPTESEAAAAVALDLNDAIAHARTAQKE